MVLDATLLNTQHYKVRIKGKVEQSRARSSTPSTPWRSSYRKGSLRVTLDYGHQQQLTAYFVHYNDITAINISITTVIQYIYNTYAIQVDSVVSGNFLTSVHGDTRRETQFLPPQRTAHLVMFKISVGRDPKNPTTSFKGPNPTHFSKSSNSQDHLFRAWRHPHSSLISCLGVYYDKWSFAHQCTNWLCTWTETWMVQIPTKLND